MADLSKLLNSLKITHKNQSSVLTKEEIGSILNCMSEGLIVYNMDLETIFMNPALAQMLIPSNPVATGRLISNPDDKILFERSTNSSKMKEIQRAMQEEPAFPRSDIIELQHPKQVLKRYSSPLYNMAGKQIGHVIIYHDITTEVENERLRSEFIATASHELRTPVTSIKVLLESLIQGAKDSPELKDEFLKDIEIEIERLHQLVNNLLDLSRYEAGRESLTIVKMNLIKVVNDAYNTVYPLASQRNVRLDVNWDDIEDIKNIIADKLRIHQILVNLLTNAIKFTPSGGNVSINVQKKDGFTEFKIADTGIGIPEEAQKHIFDKFFKVERPEVQIRGSGLGLTIVKHAVKLHKGSIHIESRPGNTIITFTIPDLKADI